MSWARREERVLTFLFICLRILRRSSLDTSLGLLDARGTADVLFAFALVSVFALVLASVSLVALVLALVLASTGASLFVAAGEGVGSFSAVPLTSSPSTLSGSCICS